MQRCRLLIACILLVYIGGVFCQNCSSVVIQGLQADTNVVGEIRLSWTAIPNNVSSSLEYQIRYRSVSQSKENSARVTNDDSQGGRVRYFLRSLSSFTTYDVSVRLSCDPGGEGPVNQREITTRSSAPTANVSNITAFTNLSSSGNLHLVRLVWTPLDDAFWNGLPLFYDVSIFRHPDTVHKQLHRVHFPSTSLLLSLTAGEYGVTIDAVNDAGASNVSATERFKVGEAGNSLTVADYPYFYIIIPGIICLVIIIVITIVIFKKVHESRKQSVSYVRDINDKVNFSGFNNMIPMRELSPQSPNTSTSLPVSSSTSSYPPPHHTHHPAQRPLPLSPITPNVLPAEDSMHFSMGPQPTPHMTTSASAGALKLSTGPNHPGPLPSLTENVEHSGAYPIARTMTNQSLGSVFSPNNVATPPGHTPIPPQQQHSGHTHPRGRSNTMGGIPSPYEVPDTNNGNTLPHDMHRPSSAHPTQRNNSDMGGSFPPPPTHSPPPLTQSSGDMRSRMVDEHMHHHGGGGAMGGHHHHHGYPHPQQHHPPSGNTLPRASPSQRSFSTSAAHGRMVNDSRGGGMTSMRSEGNIPSPPDNDAAVFHTQSSTGAENTVYIQPPLDSDLELQSTSSYGEAPPPMGGRRQSGDRGRPGHAPHHPPPSQQPRYPGMLNGPLDSGEHFNHMEVEGMVPAHMANPHHHHEHTIKEKEKGRRESMFSETSTELSITSGSEKESSPSGGWDREHKVARSDVGAPRHHHHHRHQRHMRSSTPPERDFQANGFV